MTHEHNFGTPKFKVVQMCKVAECTDLRIGTKRGGWRELTTDERLTVLARMMQDVAIAQAMTIIHGKERGLQRAREALGYD